MSDSENDSWEQPSEDDSNGREDDDDNFSDNFDAPDEDESSNVSIEKDDEPPSKRRKLTNGQPKATKKSSTSKSTKTKKSPSSKSTKKSTKSSNKKSAGTRDADKAADILKQYLEDQNRPFSVQNLTDNLRGQAGKAVITKAVEKLVKKGFATEKVNGKQKVYQINQNKMKILGDKDLSDLQDKIQTTEKQNGSLREEVQQLENKLKKLKKEPTNAELDSVLQTLQEQINQQRSRLEELSTTELISPDEKKKLMDAMNTYLSEWKKRKRWCVDILDMFCGDTMSMKQIAEKVQIETDEEAGVDIDKMGHLR